jgi:hypothetical protein
MKQLMKRALGFPENLKVRKELMKREIITFHFSSLRGGHRRAPWLNFNCARTRDVLHPSLT